MANSVMTLDEYRNRPLDIKGVKKTQTLRVRILGEFGGPGIINVKDYNEELHQKLEEGDTGVVDADAAALEQAKVSVARQRAEAARYTSVLTRADLTVMTPEAIRELGEWKKIPASKRNKAKDKQAVIDLLIKSRGK